MRRRRRFSGDLKAKVALEALRGDRTLQEIASKHQVHPNQVSTWKRQKRSKGLARCSRTVWTAVGETMKARSMSFTPRSAN